MNNNSFLALSTTLDQISNTKKRLEIQAILTSYLNSLGRDRTHLTSALYLLTASFYPDFYNKELGVGEITLIRLVSGTTGRKVTKIREEMRQTGDLGQIAMKYRISTFARATVPLSTCEVLSALRAISEIQGKDSLNEKIDMMVKLVVRSVGVETKYLIRMFEGKLKIGLALKTVLISLASCFKGLCDDKTAVENVKFAYNQCPIFETIVEELINHGSIGILNYVKIKPGVPVKPMLAQPSKNLTAAYKRFENSLFTCEFKYDGERAQIHKFGKTFKVFSRNSEDLTEKYPDLKEILGSIEKYQNDFILDAEVVAYSIIEQKILPFQLLTTRKRKDVKIDEIKVKICLFIFDCLFYQDSLLEFTLQQRREILLINFNRIQDSVHFVTQINCTSVEEIDNFFNESINSGCEGLMVKKLDSYYKPSMRSSSWIKLKKDYLEGMSETLDLLVMGAYYGKGKRTGTYGGFLIGCYDNENDCYEAVCKIGTGFDDETLKKLHKEIKNFIVKVPQNYVYKESIKPDLWIRARIIFEVRAAGFSVSPIYSAAHRLNNGNGISLRFPRMIRIRDDKGLKDVTSSKQILFMLKEFSTDNESSDDLFN